MNLEPKRDFEAAYAEIDRLVTRPLNLMEVCGTHTVAISRSGVRGRVPKALRLLSGPGCPVCVTPAGLIDAAIELALMPGVTLATFGDLLRVPGSTRSLLDARAEGAEPKIVYSPLEALDLATANPDKQVVFVGVGFETTLPVTAATIIRASDQRVENFSVLPAGRLALPAMSALLDANEVRIDGFICPGHVSAVTGWEVYKPIADRYHVPCVVTGFDGKDIIEGLRLLLLQIADGRSEVEVQYSRAVTREGNRTAVEVMRRVFEPVDAVWRGIGMIPLSGAGLNDEFKRFDALARFSVEVATDESLPEGCGCGQVMRGLIVPDECPLFGGSCIPSNPVGPCMVSSEGACAAYYRYRSIEGL